MKPLILISTLIVLATAASGQVNGEGTSSKPTYIGIDTNHWITAGQPIWSLQITGDTSKLHPIDTSYTAENNVAYQTIRYKFLDSKKEMCLTVKNYYSGKYWLFRSLTVEPYPYYGLTTSTLIQGFQFTPNYNK